MLLSCLFFLVSGECPPALLMFISGHNRWRRVTDLLATNDMNIDVAFTSEEGSVRKVSQALFCN